MVNSLCSCNVSIWIYCRHNYQYQWCLIPFRPWLAKAFKLRRMRPDRDRPQWRCLILPTWNMRWDLTHRFSASSSVSGSFNSLTVRTPHWPSSHRTGDHNTSGQMWSYASSPGKDAIKSRISENELLLLRGLLLHSVYSSHVFWPGHDYKLFCLCVSELAASRWRSSWVPSWLTCVSWLWPGKSDCSWALTWSLMASRSWLPPMAWCW